MKVSIMTYVTQSSYRGVTDHFRNTSLSWTSNISDASVKRDLCPAVMSFVCMNCCEAASSLLARLDIMLIILWWAILSLYWNNTATTPSLPDTDNNNTQASITQLHYPHILWEQNTTRLQQEEWMNIIINASPKTPYPLFQSFKILQ